MKLPLRRISTFTLILLTITTLFALISNIMIYHPTLNFLDSIESQIEQMGANVEQSNYPSRALLNISNLRDELKNKAENQILYADFRDQMRDSIRSTSNIATHVIAEFAKLSESPSFFSRLTVDDLRLLESEIESIRSEYTVDLVDITIFSDLNQHNDLIITQEGINSSMDDLERYVHTIKENYKDNGMFMFNILFVVIMVLSMVEAFIIIHMITFEKKLFDAMLNALNSDKDDPYEFPCMDSIFTEEIELCDAIKKYFSEWAFVNVINNHVHSQYEMDELLNTVFKLTHEKLDFDRLGVAFVDWNNNTIIAEHGVAKYDNILLGPGFQVPMSETTLSEQLENPTCFITHDLQSSFETRPDSPSLSLLRQEGIQSNLVIPIVVDGKTQGFVFLSSLETNHFTDDHVRLSKMIIDTLSSALFRSYLVKVLFSQMINSFSTLVDNKDIETGDHLNRMSQFSRVIAETLYKMDFSTHPVSKSFIREIETYSVCHDIGKIGVPDHILKKPGKLTEEEFDVIKKHPLVGGEIFDEIHKGLSIFNESYFKTAKDIALYHHEKWNGTGYPNGLKGFDIPLAARIIAVADVFDALCSKRVYKDAFPIEDAISIIRNGREEHFDPIVVDAFLISIDKIITIQQMEENPTVSDHEEDQ